VVNIYNRERDWSIVNVLIMPRLGLIARLNVIARSSAVAQWNSAACSSCHRLSSSSSSSSRHMSLNFGTSLVRSRAWLVNRTVNVICDRGRSRERAISRNPLKMKTIEEVGRCDMVACSSRGVPRVPLYESAARSRTKLHQNELSPLPHANPATCDCGIELSLLPQPDRTITWQLEQTAPFHWATTLDRATTFNRAIRPNCGKMITFTIDQSRSRL
jgi:hypothetical protein